MNCANCNHPLEKHVLSVDRCNHPAGPDAHCTCPEFVLPDNPKPLIGATEAKWIAPCPHCEAMAEWRSTGITAAVIYDMNCPECGPVKWLAGKP